MQQKNYDYIFLGAGCASLSIIMRMIPKLKTTGRGVSGKTKMDFLKTLFIVNGTNSYSIPREKIHYPSILAAINIK
jgi:hypothetical protein